MLNFNPNRYNLTGEPEDEPGISLFPEGGPADEPLSEEFILRDMVKRANEVGNNAPPAAPAPAPTYVPEKLPEAPPPERSGYTPTTLDAANPLLSMMQTNRERNYATADTNHNAGNIGDFFSLASRAIAGIGNVRGKSAETAVPQYMADLKKTATERADRLNKADEDYAKVSMQKALIDSKTAVGGQDGYKAKEAASRTALNQARAANVITEGEYQKALSDPTSSASLMARLMAAGFGMNTAPDTPGSSVYPLLKSLGGAYNTNVGYEAGLARSAAQQEAARIAAEASLEKQNSAGKTQKEMNDARIAADLEKNRNTVGAAKGIAAGKNAAALQIAKQKAADAKAAAALKAKGGTNAKGVPNKAVDDLRKEYQKQKIVGESSTLRSAYERLQSGLKDPSPAGDVALLYGYMKILDPGSTVREGEFATAQNAGSAFERLGGAYNRLMKGERLTTKQRADFAQSAKGTYQGQIKALRETNNQYKKLAKSRGLSEKDLLLQGERKKIRLPSGFKGNRISYQGKPFSWNAAEKVYEEEE